MYPENYCALIYGLSGVVGSAFWTFIPQFVTMMKFFGVSPYVPISIVCLICMVLIFFCPETKGQPTVEAVEEEKGQEGIELKLLEDEES